MNLTNPLPATWQAVSVVTAAYEITRRVLERTPSQPAECKLALQYFQRKLREDTLFEDNQTLSLLQTTNGKPSQEREEIEGLLVLGLWATFERFLRDYLLEKGSVLKQHVQPTPLADSLYKQFAKNVERWEPRDILDLLKDSLFTTPTLANLIGEAKHILDYRNKVAHANPKKRESRRLVYSTYEKLNEIINILLQN